MNCKILLSINLFILLTGQASACEDAPDKRIIPGKSGDISLIFQTSFDCAHVAHNIEYLICHDAELAYYDRKLAEVEKAARFAVADLVELEKNIQHQRYIRSQFCIDKNCLKIWYSKQIEAMAYVVRMKTMPK